MGLHMLGYDWTKGTSSMTAALAEGLATGATKQQPVHEQVAQAQMQSRVAQVQAQASSDMVWYVAAGAAVVAALIFLLRRPK